MDTLTHIEKVAHESAFGLNPLLEPTAAQCLAGNYKVGRALWHGLSICIEQPRGSYRHGIGEDGVKWSSRMDSHYGYFSKTKGADGDPVDCFIGYYHQSPVVFCINQNNKDGSFDEHKFMLAYPDEPSARMAYLNCYERGWTGLGSIIPMTINQLKWWLKYGNEKLPLNPKNLPYEGNEMEQTRITAWDENANPTMDINELMYQLRRADDGLMLDSVTMSEIIENSDGVVMLDGVVLELSKIEPKMNLVKTLMERAGSAVKPVAMQVSEPFMQRGTANVAVIYELSDGQTISVFFHNPDVTPKKIAPTDELISWKWLLNKKDITIVVAPERGAELNVREVARRVMKLAEKNSDLFKRANAKRAERLASIEVLKTDIDTLEKELNLAINDVEVAQREYEDWLAKEQSKVSSDSSSLDKNKNIERFFSFENRSNYVTSAYDTGFIKGTTGRWNKDGRLYVKQGVVDGETIYAMVHETAILKEYFSSSLESLKDKLKLWLRSMGDDVSGKELTEGDIYNRIKFAPSADYEGADVLSVANSDNKPDEQVTQIASSVSVETSNEAEASQNLPAVQDNVENTDPQQGNDDDSSKGEVITAFGNTYAELDPSSIKPKEMFEEALKEADGDSSKAAQLFFKSKLSQKFIKTVIGNVFLVGKSLDEMKRGMNIDGLKAQLIANVPEILSSGKHRGRESLYKNRNDFVAFHFFEKNINVGEFSVLAGVSVGERGGNQLEYSLEYTAYGLNHEHNARWQKKEALGTAGQNPASYASPDSDESSILDSTLQDDSEDVNINITILKVIDTRTGERVPELEDKIEEVTQEEGSIAENQEQPETTSAQTTEENPSENIGGAPAEPTLENEPRPEPVSEPKGVIEGEGFLMQVINREIDLLSDDVGAQLLALAEGNVDNPDFMALFSKALDVYQQAMLEATAGLK